MSNRVRQFIRGIMAKGPDNKERQMIDELLEPRARQVFFSMNVADQRHSLNVLYTALKFAQNEDKHIDLDFLKRCCLLHDVGRGDKMGCFRKSYAVLLDKLFHEWAIKIGGSINTNPLNEIMYRYYHHAEISSDILKNMGMEREANIVLRHHSGEKTDLAADEMRILEILMMADEIN